MSIILADAPSQAQSLPGSGMNVCYPRDICKVLIQMIHDADCLFHGGLCFFFPADCQSLLREINDFRRVLRIGGRIAVHGMQAFLLHLHTTLHPRGPCDSVRKRIMKSIRAAAQENISKSVSGLCYIVRRRDGLLRESDSLPGTISRDTAEREGMIFYRRREMQFHGIYKLEYLHILYAVLREYILRL